MPSFDIVNQVNLQEVDNAVNNTVREVSTRYDFRGSNTQVGFDKKTKTISLLTADDMKMQALQDMLIAHCVKRKVDPKCLDLSPVEGTSHGHIKREAKLQEGIARDTAQKMVKQIKGMKIKVQAAIQDDQVSVTGKKIDDLQAVIAEVKKGDYGIPLQFTNIEELGSV